MTVLKSPATAPAVNWDELTALCGETAVRPATEADAVDGVTPRFIGAPTGQRMLADAVAWATRHGLHVAPRGGASKMGWGNAPSSLDLVLSLEHFARVIEYAWEDLTVTVQAGVTIAELQRTLGEHNQRLALDPLFPDRATVGGVIATNDSGALRLRYGSVRDLLIGATVALADGTVASSGGKVVKNVAGYDLPKLLTGSLGTLGVITEATFRVHPMPRQAQTLTFAFADVASAQKFILALADSTLVPASVQLRTGAGQNTEVDVLFEGIEAGIAAQATQARQLAAGADVVAAPPTVWRAREALFTAADTVAKMSVLPSDIAFAVAEIAKRLQNWSVVAQGTGLTTIAINDADPAALPGKLMELRTAAQAHHGSLVVQKCAPELKKHVDVWGPAAAQHLMMRVKQQFDPQGTLNPGRFVGGI